MRSWQRRLALLGRLAPLHVNNTLEVKIDINGITEVSENYLYKETRILGLPEREKAQKAEEKCQIRPLLKHMDARGSFRSTLVEAYCIKKGEDGFKVK